MFACDDNDACTTDDVCDGKASLVVVRGGVCGASVVNGDVGVQGNCAGRNACMQSCNGHGVW